MLEERDARFEMWDLRSAIRDDEPRGQQRGTTFEERFARGWRGWHGGPGYSLFVICY